MVVQETIGTQGFARQTQEKSKVDDSYANGSVTGTTVILHAYQIEALTAHAIIVGGGSYAEQDRAEPVHAAAGGRGKQGVHSGVCIF